MDEDNDRLLAVREVWIDPNFSYYTRQVCTFVFSLCLYIVAMDFGHVMIGVNLSAKRFTHHFTRTMLLISL